MDAKNIKTTRREYNMIAEKRGIQNPQDMSINGLLDALSRYDSKRKVYIIRRKLQRLGLEKIAKLQNISKKDFNKVKKMQEKSIDEFKAIARSRKISNFIKLTKEDLILTLLKSESNALENNNNNNNNNTTTNNNNHNNSNNNANNDNDKISYIRIVLRRLGNTITNKDRKKI